MEASLFLSLSRFELIIAILVVIALVAAMYWDSRRRWKKTLEHDLRLLEVEERLIARIEDRLTTTEQDIENMQLNQVYCVRVQGESTNDK